MEFPKFSGVIPLDPRPRLGKCKGGNRSHVIMHMQLQGGQKVSHYQVIKKIVLNRIKACQ